MNNSVTRCIFETLTMKAAALILSALFFTSISGAASAHGLGEADIRNLAEAYGYASVFWARRQASSRMSEVRAATTAGACIRPSR